MSNTVKLNLIFESRRDGSFPELEKRKRKPVTGTSYLLSLVAVVILTVFSSTMTHCSAQVEMGFKSYGSSCDRSSECNRNLWLECRRGRCGCTVPSATFFNESLSRCLGKIGSSCFHFGVGPHCPENSVCKLTSSLYSSEEAGTRQHYRGRCQPRMSKYGELCDEDEESSSSSSAAATNGSRRCEGGMTCSKGKCECNSGNNQYYNQALGNCIILPNGPCNSRWKQAVCAPNSDCVSWDETFSCQCYPGTSIDSLSRQCKMNYMGPCSSRSSNDSNSRSPGNDISYEQDCNSDKFLTCLEGACNCKSPLHQKYSLRLRKCVTLVGSSCSSTASNSSNIRRTSHQMGKVDITRNITSPKVSNESYPRPTTTTARPSSSSLPLPPCTENAECSPAGKCKCKRDSYETPDRTCKLDMPHGSACDDGQCNNFKGMVCKDRRCQCLDASMFYDEETKTCYSTRGSYCGKLGIIPDGISREHDSNIYVQCSNTSRCTETEFGSHKCA